MWALIVDGLVREITEIDPAGRFHPSLEWRECGPDVREGWIFDGRDFAAPEPEPEPVPQSITFRQLVLGTMSAGWVSPADAEAWAARSSLPKPVTDTIAQLPEAERPAARITALTMSGAYRNDALLFAAARAAMPGATEQEVNAALDQAFREWSAL